MEQHDRRLHIGRPSFMTVTFTGSTVSTSYQDRLQLKLPEGTWFVIASMVWEHAEAANGIQHRIRLLDHNGVQVDERTMAIGGSASQFHPLTVHAIVTCPDNAIIKCQARVSSVSGTQFTSQPRMIAIPIDDHEVVIQ